MVNLDIYNKWVGNLFKKIPFSHLFDFKEKDNNAFTHIMYMLNRTQSLFKYTGLPDSIPARMIEIYLQISGHCCITKVNDTLYALTGGLGGEPDPYYMPTIYTVANPALDISRSLKIGEDCIILNNDSMYIGLMPLFNRHASMLAENELSLSLAVINSRIIDLIVAEDDQTKESAERFLEKVAAGEMGVIGSNAFIAGLKTLPYTSAGHSNNITQLIEFEQYEKAAWLNDLGLNANYNMKREALSTAESQLNDDSLRPLIDDMLNCRKIALEKVNEMFGTDIQVELSSAWGENMEEIQLELDSMAAQVKQLEEDPEEAPEEAPEEEKEKEDKKE